MSPTLSLINGPNLNWLGRRERPVYGTESWEDIWKDLEVWGQANDIHLSYFQSNSEGALIDHLQSIDAEVQGVVFNPAAYAHTSIALRDCVAAMNIPVVEVHLSNIYRRESFRRHSCIAEVAQADIVGFGARGYRLGLEFLKYWIQHDHSQ